MTLEVVSPSERYPPWFVNKHRRLGTRLASLEEYKEEESVIVISSAHGKLRRLERNVSKKDLKTAVKCGTKKMCGCDKEGKPRYMYTFADIVYITDSTSTKEVTSWAIPISSEYIHITRSAETAHQEAKKRILDDPSSWTSYSVVIVDQSGSMKKQGSPGFRHRSDTIWYTLAMNYIADRIADGTRCATDLISIIAMRDGKADLIIEKEPFDHILFNRIMQFRETQLPSYAGNYIPCLQKAKELMEQESNAICGYHLLLFSDGRPSDFHGCFLFTESLLRDQINQVMTNLCKRFGSRLSFSAIAISSPGMNNTEFEILNSMVDVARDFRCSAEFHDNRSTGFASALAKTVSSTTTSLTATKSEMSKFKDSSEKRHLKMYFHESRSESFNDALILSPTNNWKVSECVTRRKLVYKKEKRHNGKVFDKPVLEEDRLADSQSDGVAFKRNILGEGAERIVRAFREVMATKKCYRFVGPHFVAKESKFVEDDRDATSFHLKFMITQHRANKIAMKFNNRLEGLSCSYSGTETIPRIEFLECAVYEVDGLSMLVEERLDVKNYEKWNSNSGFVNSVSPEREVMDSANSENLPYNRHRQRKYVQHSELPRIEEDREFLEKPQIHMSEPSEVLQAFSHFSYNFTKREKLVCDLQGVYDHERNTFRLTDPVIHTVHGHTHNRKTDSDDSNDVEDFGRTDRGRRGIVDFFRSHKCTALCRALRLDHFDYYCGNKKHKDSYLSHQRKNIQICCRSHNYKYTN